MEESQKKLQDKVLTLHDHKDSVKLLVVISYKDTNGRLLFQFQTGFYPHFVFDAKACNELIKYLQEQMDDFDMPLDSIVTKTIKLTRKEEVQEVDIVLSEQELNDIPMVEEPFATSDDAPPIQQVLQKESTWIPKVPPPSLTLFD